VKTEKKITQHVQVPTKIRDNTNTMNIGEYYMYSWLKFFDGPKGCFPSQKVLSEKSHLGIKLIKSLITSLADKGFISITKKGRSNYYEFAKYEKFQRYSMLFMKNNVLTPNEKMFLMYMQQYMYLDNTMHEGRISFTVDKMKEITSMSNRWIYNVLQSLTDKGLVTKLMNKSRDTETGCNTVTYIFDLDQIGQNLLFKQVTKNTEDIEKQKIINKDFAKQLSDIKKQLAALLKDKMIENKLDSIITL